MPRTYQKTQAITIIATATIERYRFVGYGGTHASTSADMAGVSEMRATAGQPVSAVTEFSMFVEAAEDIAVGAYVKPASDGSGMAVNGTAGDNCGRALTAATGLDLIFECRLGQVGGGGGGGTGGSVPEASQTAVEDVGTTDAGSYVSPRRLVQALNALAPVGRLPVATQQEAEAGLANDRAMTPLQVKRAIAALTPPASFTIASDAEADAGVENTKAMTAARVARAINTRAPDVVRSSALTGLSTSDASPVVPGVSVLQALGRVQAQLNGYIDFRIMAWADRDTPSTGAGTAWRLFTGAGAPAPGLLCWWSGTRWKLMFPTPIVFDNTLRDGVAQTAAQVIPQGQQAWNRVAANILSTCTTFAVRYTPAKSGTTAAMSVARPRLNPLGDLTGGQLAGLGASALVAGDRHRGCVAHRYVVDSATQLRIVHGASGAGGLVGDSATAAANGTYAIANHTTQDLYLSMETQMAATTDTPQLATLELVLEP